MSDMSGKLLAVTNLDFASRPAIDQFAFPRYQDTRPRPLNFAGLGARSNLSGKYRKANSG
jgi:hypothetical protein